MEPDVTLLANPTAGRGRAARLIDAAHQRFTAAGITVTATAGATAEDSLRLAHEAVERGTRALVVLGGDGMCHLALQAVAGTPTALGIVPAGTGNDLAGELGIPTDPDAAVDTVVEALRTGHTRTVDAARVGSRWWAGVLCAGFDSAVNERANAMRWPRGPRRYDLAIFVELARLRPRPFTLVLDGEQIDTDATLVAVGNTATYGGGLRMCPSARTDDGLFDITIVGPVSRTTLVRVKPRLRTGTHVTHPAVTVRQAREVQLFAPGVTAYADGERLAPLPVTATCVPGAVHVLTPPQHAR